MQSKNNVTSNFNTSYHIGLCVGQKGVRSPVGYQAGIEKNTTNKNISKDNPIVKCRKTTLFSKFNCQTLNFSKRLGEVTAIAQEQNIDIIMSPRTSDLS